MKRRVSILCHTVSGNALGRAWVFRELLADDFEVELVVSARTTDSVWAPLREQVSGERRWFVHTWPGFRGRARRLASALVTGDLLIAIKPRLHSFGLALAARSCRPRPLLLDVDDWELGFFSPWRDTLEAPFSWISATSNLYTRWYCGKTGLADGISVSSTFLQERFGGTLIPHARRSDISPAGAERWAAEPLVMFIGTPRAHKGLEDLVRAFKMVQLPEARLDIIGAFGNASLEALIQGDARISLKPPAALAQLPALLETAWLVAIPQRDEAPSAAQLPAKLMDAMALGRAVVSTKVGDIPKWLAHESGVVVPPGDPVALAEAMQALLTDRSRLTALGNNARRRFQRLGSHQAVKPRLLALVEALLAGKRSPELPLVFD
jgi:glycosyltransferase involved in cell wall biosynthesis